MAAALEHQFFFSAGEVAPRIFPMEIAWFWTLDSIHAQLEPTHKMKREEKRCSGLVPGARALTSDT